MYTAEKILNAYRYLFSTPDRVITKQEAQLLAKKGMIVDFIIGRNTMHSEDIIVFVGSATFGKDVISGWSFASGRMDWVDCEKKINTVDEYLSQYYPGYKCIETIEELVNHLNESEGLINKDKRLEISDDELSKISKALEHNRRAIENWIALHESEKDALDTIALESNEAAQNLIKTIYNRAS